jgi:hypothetical protein
MQREMFFRQKRRKIQPCYMIFCHVSFVTTRHDGKGGVCRGVKAARGQGDAQFDGKGEIQ